MANSSRRKHKAIAKITYDELLDSSSMQGFVSFLDQVPPTLGRVKTNSALDPVLALDQFPAPSPGKQQLTNTPSLGIPDNIAASSPWQSIPNGVANTHLGDASQLTELATVPISSGIPEKLSVGIPNEVINVHPGDTPQFTEFAAIPSSSGIPDERSVGIPTVHSLGIPEKPSVGIPNEVTNVHPGGTPQFTEFAAIPGSSGIPEKRSIGIPNVRFLGMSDDPMPRIPTERVHPARQDVPDQPPPRNIYNQILERHLKLQRANLAQDAHSSSENAVYDFLWREGKALIDEGRRQVVVGYGMVAGKLKLGRNTVIRAVESLEKKLAIERLGAQGNSGQCYLVYSYAETLHRRRMAGLVWYVKDRNGRLLLSEKDLDISVVPFTTQGSMGIPGKTSPGIPRKNLGMPTLGTPSIPSVGIPRVPNEQTPPYRISENTLSSRHVDDEAIEILEQNLLKTEFSSFDRKAITTIWRQSRASVPDITPDEVLEVFFGKAQVLARSKTVENKNGLLLWAWPSLLTPARVAQLREKRNLEKEVTSAESTEYLAKLHQILSDPDASEEEKRLVKQLLQMKEKEGEKPPPEGGGYRNGL